MTSYNLILRESTGEIPTNYTRKYAETRGWKEWEVVREFVQNSLDATGSVAIEKTADGLLITDKGKGFNALNLLMGTTTKSQCDRGRFGEGMKIACLAALNLGYEVEIDTDSMHITPAFKLLEIEEPAGGISSAEILVFKYHKITSVGGTKVFVKGYIHDTFEDRFNLEYNKKIILKKALDICENKNYNSYILDELAKRIYVRNIYVHDINPEKPALFSYDLFDVTLSTDRNIPSTRDINNQIGRLWSCISSPDLIEKFFKHVEAEGYEEEVKLSGGLLHSSGAEGAWKSTFKKMYGKAFLTTSDKTQRLAEYHSHFLRKGVSVPSGIRYALEAIGIQRDIDVLEAIKSVLPRYPALVTPIQQDNFEYMRRIHNVLKEKYFPGLKLVYLASRDTMFDSEGKALDGNIYIRDDRADTMVHIIDVYGHEATHIVFPKLSDNTSDFYSKIGQVMAMITKVVVQEKITAPPNVVW
ncbi:MAG: hypothetical protein V1854_04790 [Methanobacteriota archaeon]